MTLLGDEQEVIPLDIRPEWYALIRRCQSLSNTGGIAILSMHVLVDEQGNPMMWLPPKCQRIEPTKRARDILKELLERDGFGV